MLFRSKAIFMITSVYFVCQLKRPGFLSFLAWINAIINIALCFVLIPRYVAVGAAMASTLTYIIGFLILLIVLKTISGLTPSMLLFIKRGDFSDYLNVFANIRQFVPFFVRRKAL